MAIVGSAYVVVRAITDKVEGDIRKGFSGASSSAEAGGKDIGNALIRGLGGSMKRTDPFSNLGRKLRSLYPDANDAAESFTHLMRRGMTTEAGMGALAGTLGSLVGALGSLVGAAGLAAGSVAALAETGAALKIGFGVAKFALGGVGQAFAAATKVQNGYSFSTQAINKQLKDLRFNAEEAALSEEKAAITLEKARTELAKTQDLPPDNLTRREAELAYKEADLNYRKAKANTIDLQKQVKKGRAGITQKMTGDPYAGLTKSQREFTQFIVGLKPQFQALREESAKGFLPVLEDQIKRLIDSGLMGTLKKGFGEVGTALGESAKNFTNVVLAGNSLKNLGSLLSYTAKILPTFGTMLGRSFGTFLTILKVAQPLTDRFVKFLDSKNKAFANFIDTKTKTGELATFFKRAGDMAAKFGTVFGNTFGAVSKIIQAQFGAGSGGNLLLNWLGEVTAGWKNMNMTFLTNYFKQSTTNFIAAANAIGGALETIIKAGASPATAEFWKSLDGGSYAFTQIVNASVKAAPALGRILQSITEIVAAFADSSQVTTFLDTINYFLRGVSEILNALKPVMDFFGPLVGMISGVTLVMGGFTKAFLVGIGFVAKMVTGLGFLLPQSLMKFSAAEKVAATTSEQTTLALQAQVAALTELIGANKVAAITAEGTAVAMEAEAVASDTATVATKGFAIAMKTALASNPVGWIILAVGALVELGTALAGIHAENMQKAMDGVSSSMERGATAADTWSQAVLAVPDGYYKNQISNLADMKTNIQKLKKAQQSWGNTSITTTALADSFGAMGRSLANLGTTDLPKAQTQFRNFTAQAGLSNSEIAVAVNEMDEYKKALLDAAKAQGYNLYTKKGDIDQTKLAQFATGTYKDAVVDLKNAQTELAKRTADSIKETTNFGDAIQKTVDGGKQNASSLISNYKKELATTSNFQTNLQLLRSQGYTDLADSLATKGVSAASLVGNLVKGKASELKVLNDQAKAAAYKATTGFTDGMAKAQPLLDLAGTKLSAAALKGFETKILNAKSDTEFKAAVNSLEAALTAAGVAIPVDIKPLWNPTPAEIASISKQISGSFSKNPNLRSGFRGQNGTGNKDGGYISGFSNGGLVKSFALGGAVTGLGTARSDSIPSMLSNGEFVVNARATASNRKLLEEINSNRSVTTGSNINLSVHAAPGMSEQEIAQLVTARLQFEMRKGASL